MGVFHYSPPPRWRLARSLPAGGLVSGCGSCQSRGRPVFRLRLLNASVTVWRDLTEGRSRAWITAPQTPARSLARPPVRCIPRAWNASLKPGRAREHPRAGLQLVVVCVFFFFFLNPLSSLLPPRMSG